MHACIAIIITNNLFNPSFRVPSLQAANVSVKLVPDYSVWLCRNIYPSRPILRILFHDLLCSFPPLPGARPYCEDIVACDL